MLDRRYLLDDTSLVASNLPDKTEPSGNLIHHTKHVPISLRFEGNNGARTGTNRDRSSDTGEPAKHYSIKRIESTEAPSSDKAKTSEHHSINFKVLSQRYGQLAPVR